MEGGVGGPGGEVEVPGAPLGVEAAGHSHGLQQGGLARAVLPHQKGHAGGKEEGVLPVPQSPHRREGRQVAVRRDGLAQVDAVDVAAWQWDHLFLRGISPPGGGRFRPAGRVTFWMCPESNQRGTKGQAQDGHSRAHIRPPPGPPFYGGRQLGCLSNDRKGAGGSADWSPFYYRCR